MTPLFFVIGHDALSVYARQGGQLVCEGIFHPNTASWDAFPAYLRQKPNQPCQLLLNNNDEAWCHDRIPLTGRRDRQHLIERRRQQHFPGHEFSLATLLPRNKDGYPLRLASIGHSEVLEACLNLLEQSGQELQGIYTLSQLTVPMLRLLGRSPARCLVMVALPNALREIYLDDGQVSFTRQINRRTSSPALAQLFVDETHVLHQYLLGQQLVEREARLPVYCLPPSEMPDLVLPDMQGPLEFLRLDPHTIAKRLKLEPAIEDNTLLFLALPGKALPKQQFAPPRHLRLHRQAVVDRRLRNTGLTILATSILFAGQRLLNAEQQQQARDALQPRIALIERQHQALLEQLPPQSERSHLLHLADAQRALHSRQHTPEAALMALGKVMEETAHVRLDNIEWRYEPQENAEALAELILTGHIDKPSGEQPPMALQGFIEAINRNPQLQVATMAPRHATTSAPSANQTFQLTLQHRGKP